MVSFLLKVKCSKIKFDLEIDDIATTILNIKEKIFAEKLLDVQPKYMKIMINGKLAKNDNKLSECNLKIKEDSELVTVKCQILIMKGHHDENKGKKLVQNTDKILKQLEKELNDIKSRLKARMIKKEDVLFEIGMIQERLLKRESEIQQSVVRETDLEDKEAKLAWIGRLKKLLDDIEIIKTS